MGMSVRGGCLFRQRGQPGLSSSSGAKGACGCSGRGDGKGSYSWNGKGLLDGFASNLAGPGVMLEATEPRSVSNQPRNSLSLWPGLALLRDLTPTWVSEIVPE